MDLVWSQRLAEESYCSTVRSCPNIGEIGIPELISAMAAGWKSKLIVELWCMDYRIEESVGLTIAARHTGGRHVCIVPDESSKEDYLKKLQQMRMEPPELVVVDLAGTAVPRLEEVDFLVMDFMKQKFSSVLRAVKLKRQGAVLACKNIRATYDSRTQVELTMQQETGMRAERFVFGNLFDVVHLGSMTHGAPSPLPQLRSQLRLSPPQSQPQPRSQPQPQPQSQLRSQPQSQAQAQPRSQPQSQAQAQPRPQPRSQPQPPSPRSRRIWFKVRDPRCGHDHIFEV